MTFIETALIYLLIYSLFKVLAEAFLQSTQTDKGN